MAMDQALALVEAQAHVHGAQGPAGGSAAFHPGFAEQRFQPLGVRVDRTIELGDGVAERLAFLDGPEKRTSRWENVVGLGGVGEGFQGGGGEGFGFARVVPISQGLEHARPVAPALGVEFVVEQA
jgi:hypothetical protein